MAVLQAQMQQAVSNATAQLRMLQQQQHEKRPLDSSVATPKARDILAHKKQHLMPAFNNNRGRPHILQPHPHHPPQQQHHHQPPHPFVSLALSNLRPIPPNMSMAGARQQHHAPPPQSALLRPLAVSASVAGDNGFPSPNASLAVPRLDLPADENVDLEELEQFAKEFKQKRIKLGNA